MKTYAKADNFPHARFSIRTMNFSRGLRAWAFERPTGYDAEVGLSPDGYATTAEALEAIRRVDPTARVVVRDGAGEGPVELGPGEVLS